MKTCLPAGQKWRHETCIQCLQDVSSDWRETSMILAAYMSLSNFFEDMSSPCLLTIYGIIGIFGWFRCVTNLVTWIYSNINGNQIIKECLHVNHSKLFMDAQLQLQPIQPGKQAVCELWIACVCHHINNGWEQELAGLLWFVRTTTDVVQTTTPN